MRSFHDNYPFLSNVRHRAMITLVSPLLTGIIHISPSCSAICRLKL